MQGEQKEDRSWSKKGLRWDRMWNYAIILLIC